jgi:XTP/dITP diphosphohydrolase
MKKFTKLVLASQNRKKLSELKAVLEASSLELEVLLVKDLTPDFDPVEDGKSFEENALIKARAAFEATGFVALADDSGLVVDALDGAPGIFSSRFAGPEANDKANNQKLLKAMENVPKGKRQAHFSCTIALVGPNGFERTAHGRLDGEIAFEMDGEHGFGYDPLFFLPSQKCTLAQLDSKIKNKLSHRYHALSQLPTLLLELENSIED